MAKSERVITEYIDDMDNKPVAEDEVETVKFSVGNKTYQLDLRATNRVKFDKALAPFIEAAAVISNAKRPRQRAGTGSGRSKKELNEIREWATENGYEVSARGRVSATILEAYDSEH